MSFSSPGDLPNPGAEPESPALAGGFFTSGPPGKLFQQQQASYHYYYQKSLRVTANAVGHITGDITTVRKEQESNSIITLRLENLRETTEKSLY